MTKDDLDRLEELEKAAAQGPFCIGFDLAAYGPDRNYAVVVSGTKEKAVLVECAQTKPQEPFTVVMYWIEHLVSKYTVCRAVAWKDHVTGPALERSRFGPQHTRVRLYAPTRNEKERLAWQVRMMCEYGRIDLTELPGSHQIASAIAIDILPIGNAPHLIALARKGLESTGNQEGE